MLRYAQTKHRQVVFSEIGCLNYCIVTHASRYIFASRLSVPTRTGLTRFFTALRVTILLSLPPHMVKIVPFAVRARQKVRRCVHAIFN